jgi:hypothetical protein
MYVVDFVEEVVTVSLTLLQSYRALFGVLLCRFTDLQILVSLCNGDLLARLKFT